jgi:mRNA interferase MazF
MTRYKFGGVVLVLFQQMDGNKKQRPALVVLDTGDDDIVLAPITTTERKGKGDYRIKNWQESGLLLHSWVRLAKIACLSKSDISKRLGVFSAGDEKQVVLLWNKVYRF